MNFANILKALFGSKADRDEKLIRPFVEKVKAAYPALQQLSNDELRARSAAIRTRTCY